MAKVAVDEDLIAQINITLAELEARVTLLKVLVERIMKGE